MARTRRTRQRARSDRRRSETGGKKPPAGTEPKSPAGGRAKERTRLKGASHEEEPRRKPERPEWSDARRSKTRPENTRRPRGVRSRSKRRRKLSRHPEAVRSRRRRREARRLQREEIGVRDQLRYERDLDRQRHRARRAKVQPDERVLALSWLEEIRNVVASVFRCSLATTEAVESNSEDEGREFPDRQRENMRTAWLAVGRYDPQDPIGYADLALALDLVRSDLTLESVIHPQRMSQIRVVYADPDATRGEGDSIVSKIGAWEFVIAVLVREIGGAGEEDEEALARRYKATRIPRFYIYFAAEVVPFRDAWRWKIG